MKRVNFHWSRAIGNFSLYSLDDEKGAPGGSVLAVLCAYKSKTTLFVSTLSKFIYFPALLYSIFLPLQLGTIWFYVGLPITLIGLVGTILVLVDWARTQVGQPITRGMHRYSRHPSM